MGFRVTLLILIAALCMPAHGTDAGYSAKAVDLLERPGLQAKVVTKLAKRQPVEILGRDGSWAHAKSGNATGWVRLADLRLSVGAAKSPASPSARANPGAKKDTGIRGFSEEELLVGAPNQAEGEKLRRLGSACQGRSQLEGAQDTMAGKDTKAARAYKKQTQAMALQGKQMEEQMRKDPNYVRAQEQNERKQREFQRKNPSGFETEFNLSDAEEAELGFGMAQQFLSNQRLVADEALQRYVNSVGVWVTQQSERPNLPWRFAVIEGEAPNAFAVPGGYVFITLGMLALAESESELAGILGHEISHVVRKHHLRWIYMNKDLEVSVRRAEEQIGQTSAASREMFQEMGKVMQRFEAASRDRYGADSALAGHPEPLQRLKMLDVALRSRDEKDTLGELAAERFRRATQRVRHRSG